MQRLNAQVHNGRLVLDEPTDLAEGEIVCLQPVDSHELDHVEQARLNDALREGVNHQMTAGQSASFARRASVSFAGRLGRARAVWTRMRERWLENERAAAPR
jgi:hypothetical protein